jgi:hypothetical protein
LMGPGFGNALLGANFQTTARVLRTAPAAAASPQSSRGSVVRIGFLPIGAPDRVRDWFEDEIKMGYDSSMAVFVWTSAYAGIRQMERFKAYVRAGGKIDHWRARPRPTCAARWARTTWFAIEPPGLGDPSIAGMTGIGEQLPAPTIVLNGENGALSNTADATTRKFACCWREAHLGGL